MSITLSALTAVTPPPMESAHLSRPGAPPRAYSPGPASVGSSSYLLDQEFYRWEAYQDYDETGGDIRLQRAGAAQHVQAVVGAPRLTRLVLAFNGAGAWLVAGETASGITAWTSTGLEVSFAGTSPAAVATADGDVHVLYVSGTTIYSRNMAASLATPLAQVLALAAGTAIARAGIGRGGRLWAELMVAGANSSGEAVVSGARVRLRASANGPMIFSGLTGLDGTILTEPLPIGPVAASCSKLQSTGAGTLEVPAGLSPMSAPTELELDMARDAQSLTLRGTVYGPGNAPLQGATVTVTPHGGGAAAVVTETDGGGRWGAAMAAGEWDYNIAYPWLLTARYTKLLTAGQVSDTVTYMEEDDRYEA